MLIDKEKLNEVLHSFHALTGVRIGVYDKWRNEITAYPPSWCALCEALRKRADINERCKRSDEVAFLETERTGKQYTYRCHAGLIESVYPIFSEGERVGFLMIGQFADDKSKIDKAILETEVGKEQADKIISEVTTLDSSLIVSVASIASVCAQYLCFSKTISKRRSMLAQEVEKFIEEHLHEKITVDTLSKKFFLSRTSVYLTIEEGFSKSVTEFINYKKIERAKALITAGTNTSEVLEKIGVSEANYFCRLFKKHAGVSLREFKKGLRGK